MAGKPVNRIPIVGVIGSGSRKHAERSRAVGKWLAKENFHLLTGGGGGVMEAVSRAFHSVKKRKGLVIGIIPGDPSDPGLASRAGYPNPWVEIPVFTHLPLSGDMGMEPMSRNHINILTSDVIIALPGSSGTASEATLALCYRRPIVAYLDSRDMIPGLPDGIRIESDLERVKEFVRSHLPF